LVDQKRKVYKKGPLSQGGERKITRNENLKGGYAKKGGGGKLNFTKGALIWGVCRGSISWGKITGESKKPVWILGGDKHFAGKERWEA